MSRVCPPPHREYLLSIYILYLVKHGNTTRLLRNLISVTYSAAANEFNRTNTFSKFRGIWIWSPLPLGINMTEGPAVALLNT